VNLTTAALAKDVVQLVNEQLLSPTAQSTDENGDQSRLENGDVCIRFSIYYRKFFL
jgi:hypothetical protein